MDKVYRSAIRRFQVNYALKYCFIRKTSRGIFPHSESTDPRKQELENRKIKTRQKKLRTRLTCGSGELSHTLVGGSYNMNHNHGHIKEKERKAKKRNRILCVRSCDLFVQFGWVPGLGCLGC